MTTTLFSGTNHAQLYAKFRPFPPASLVKSIIEHVNYKINAPLEIAVDLGCGTGQSTVVISPYFQKVFGYDISEAQIHFAKEYRSAINIEYNVSKGETWPLQSSSVDLVTFSQSIHWFNLNEVFNEVKRILKPNGVIAVYAYCIPIPKTDLAEKNIAIDEVVNKYFYEDQLGAFSDEQSLLVKYGYTDINLPFKDIQRLSFVDQTTSSLAYYISYLRTISAYQKLFREDSVKAESILLEVEKRLSKIIESGKSAEETELSLHSNFFMLLGSK